MKTPPAGSSRTLRLLRGWLRRCRDHWWTATTDHQFGVRSPTSLGPVASLRHRATSWRTGSTMRRASSIQCSPNSRICRRVLRGGCKYHGRTASALARAKTRKPSVQTHGQTPSVREHSQIVRCRRFSRRSLKRLQRRAQRARSAGHVNRGNRTCSKVTR